MTTSRTVSGNATSIAWESTARCLARSASRASPTSRPSYFTVPLSGRSRRARTLISVDLPAPLGPMIKWSLPGANEAEMSSINRFWPTEYVMLVAWSIENLSVPWARNIHSWQGELLTYRIEHNASLPLDPVLNLTTRVPINIRSTPARIDFKRHTAFVSAEE